MQVLGLLRAYLMIYSDPKGTSYLSTIKVEKVEFGPAREAVGILH